MPKKFTLTVVIPPDLYERLTQASIEEDRSRAAVIRRSIKTYLNSEYPQNDETPR